MAFTPLLGLSLPADGTTNWGTLVNTSITALLDSAVAGTTTISSVSTPYILTATTEAANEARQAIILCTGSRAAIQTIVAPAQSKTYVVINATTGSQAVKIVGDGPTTGVTVANGGTAVLAWNGSDFVDIGASTAGNRTINGNETVSGDLAVNGSKFVMNNGAIQEHQTSVAASDINLITGNCFTKTISGATTFTVSNVPSSGTVASFILDITNGGSATVNWWSGVKWPYGTAPSLTVSGRDSLGFYTYDGGTTWTGLLLGKDIK